MSNQLSGRGTLTSRLPVIPQPGLRCNAGPALTQFGCVSSRLHPEKLSLSSYMSPVNCGADNLCSQAGFTCTHKSGSQLERCKSALLTIHPQRTHWVYNLHTGCTLYNLHTVCTILTLDVQLKITTHSRVLWSWVDFSML